MANVVTMGADTLALCFVMPLLVMRAGAVSVTVGSNGSSSSVGLKHSLQEVERTLGQELKGDQREMISSDFGQLDQLEYHDIHGDNCTVKGTWSHQNHGPVEFEASHKRVFLKIPGVPTIVQHLTQDPPMFQVGDVLATLRQPESKELRSTMSHVANSSFIDKKAKHLSSLLGRHGLDGGKAMCARRLHLLLLGLAKSGENLEGEWGWRRRKVIRTAAPKCEQGWRRRFSGHRRRGWGPYSFAEGCNENDECGCDLAAVPYGSGTGCPAHRATTWKCHWEPNGAWHRPPHDSFKVERGHAAAANGDVNCRDESQLNQKQQAAGMRCPGLCGRECDCWESICSANYACEYNPYCCAHDMTCSRRRVGHYAKCYLMPEVGIMC